MRSRSEKKANEIVRLKVIIRGAVQGVGFRPFVFRLAANLKLNGWVLNSGQGVFIEIEGEKTKLDEFILRLQNEKPSLAYIQSLEFSFLDPIGFKDFAIKESSLSEEKSAIILPDIAICPACLEDIFDPSNRRYLYPFTNCTNCGPRFSIIESLPYDRHNTTMKKFQMCKECKAEYENPLDRRFHAQPNACPNCGPQLELWNEKGKVISRFNEALLQAVEGIHLGKIIAVKGIGGFHLIVDARNNDAVSNLRAKKHREEKPFALMFPSFEAVQQECELNNFEKRLLTSVESPIVLLHRLSANRNFKSRIAPSVAPNNPYLGVMLPYTPLHHLLLKKFGFPIIATSGNLSDEPICIDENEALQRLRGIADLFLVHNRPIVRHVDDSIARIVMERELVLRRARGYAPLPINIGTQLDEHILAVGAHLKSTIALTSSNNVFISQHIGDLETKESLNAFKNVIIDFQNMYNAKPIVIACDSHPEYISSKHAKELEIEVVEVQHHYAHITSCMAENQLEGKVLGVSWDGTGYGTDGTIWGGEFLLTDEVTFERVATFRPFLLPGGEKAIKEPRRTAIGAIYEIFGPDTFNKKEIISVQSFSAQELEIIKQMLHKQIHSPITSSAGRIFDVVASLIGLRQIVNYEGQAAMELEFLATELINDKSLKIENYKFNIGKTEDKIISNKNSSDIIHQTALIIDWQPMIEGILEDINNKITQSMISLKFHVTLAEIIIAVAKRIGKERVLLSGGCFQNKILTERCVVRLIAEGFRPYWHQRVPPNDGGISLGQIFSVLNKRIKKK